MGTEDVRVAVVGLGAIGLSAAADLMQAGHQPVLCVRRAFDEVHQTGVAGDFSAPANCVTDPSAIDGPAEFVLVATKVYQTPSAQPWLDALCGPDTIVAALQNGIDHVERLAPVCHGAAVLPVVVQLPAVRVADGRVERAATGMLSVPSGDAGRRFVSLFDGADIPVRATDDWLTDAWKKLMINATTGGIGALVVRRNHALTVPGVADLALQMLEEVAAVGRAEGADLPDDIATKMIDRIVAVSSDHWSSIVLDRKEGRPLEWRTRNEVVGKLGRRHGIPTPLNDILTTLLEVADPAWEPGSGDTHLPR